MMRIYKFRFGMSSDYSNIIRKGGNVAFQLFFSLFVFVKLLSIKNMTFFSVLIIVVGSIHTHANNIATPVRLILICNDLRKDDFLG